MDLFKPHIIPLTLKRAISLLTSPQGQVALITLAIGYPWFYKTTPFLSFKGKKTGSNSSIFSGIAHYYGMRQKQPKISGIALF